MNLLLGNRCLYLCYFFGNIDRLNERLISLLLLFYLALCLFICDLFDQLLKELLLLICPVHIDDLLNFNYLLNYLLDVDEVLHFHYLFHFDYLLNLHYLIHVDHLLHLH